MTVEKARRSRLMRMTRLKVIHTSGTRAEVDTGPDRYLVVRNGGPHTLYLSQTESGPTTEVLEPPEDGRPPEEVRLRSHRFLRSAGQSNLSIFEYFA